MANEEHVALLKQGAEVWNKWLAENPDISPDLNGADLRNADLGGAILVGGAGLGGADISRARLYETVFVNTDLTRVKGLETCRHSGPSTIDHRTLQKSGPLPLAFLRGVGLPERLIDYLPSLLNQPIQFFLIERALTIFEKRYGDKNPNVAFGALPGLALARRGEGRLAEAEALYRRALTLQETAFGRDHPMFTQTSFALATLYLEQGRPVEARPLLESALEIKEPALGPNHPEVVTLVLLLVFCPRSKVPFRPLIFPDDGVGPFGPDERFRGGVAIVEVAADG
jgi:tetratricopeptide (TPR) repeat protein